MEKNNELKPFFMGGAGYFQPLPCVTVNFFASNKEGSGKNKYPYFDDEDIEKAKIKAESILKNQEDNALLIDLLSRIVGSMSLERVERFDLNNEAKELLSNLKK